MAAFSSTSFHHHHPFLLDSIFLQNSPSTTNIMSPPLLHQSPTSNPNFTQQNLPQHPDDDDDADDDACVVNKNSMENSSSIVTDKFDSKRKRKCSANSAQSKDKREVKGKKQKKIRDEEKKNNTKEENKGDYIHVRARRGQATDSHSLAERVRRERISERMKLLQDLVPGCDKVTGKALMLDEIINYVQSLQNQVEFLSMKLATLNPMFYDFGEMESFMVRADEDMSEFPSMQNNYNFMENHVLFQQAQVSNVISQPQGSRQTLWEEDDQRQKYTNQSGFNNTLFPFH